MKFPALVHKDNDSEYGVTVSDIPGCFTAGETFEKAVGNIQAAVELYFEGEDIDTLPEASEIKDLSLSSPTEGGTWYMVEIDLGFLQGKRDER